MNDELLTEILESTKETTATTGSVDESIKAMHKGLDHVSGQLDIMNHSLYVQSEYLTWLTISIMLMTAMVMFLVGYIITRK